MAFCAPGAATRPACQAPPPQLALPWPITACRCSHASHGTAHQRKKQPTAARCRGKQQRAAGGGGSCGAATAEALARLRYTSPDGQWAVRPMNKNDMEEVRRVVALQTDAFHTTAPLPILDGMAKHFFEAEVLSEMQKKLKFNPDDMFVSLVIEPAAPRSSTSSSSSDASAGNGCGSPGVVGVVEVSYISQRETLALLEPGTEGYCYIASMVVAPGWRRRGAAAALLAAAEAAAAAWDERQALLHVYQDNKPAVTLYHKAGYEVVRQQAKLWAAIGVRPRFLMRKHW